MNSIQTLLSNIATKSKSCKFQNPIQNADLKVVPKSTYRHIMIKPPKKIHGLKSFQTHVLPTNRSEIRGIDGAIHVAVQSKFRPKLYHPILNNEFISIQFFPKDHIVSNFRKSYISFFFTMQQLPLMNSPVLDTEFRSYQGKLRNLQFFKTKRKPIQSACGRTKLKKKFRQLFIDAIKETNTSKGKLAGVYALSIKKVPVNEIEDQLVRESFKKLLNKLNKPRKPTGSKTVKLGEFFKNVQYSYKVGNMTDNRVRFPFMKGSELKA
ncbi:hypothetical protein KGF54_004470 [Candida jiufengensis]|uniref:uncharacterized protein n=1 Tax=Candida jiufengensis TaxID=497108 RepID=UPI00222416F6|nr:uncharacterized protein KGF54_004470 [Candida jiufengensis]KAI5951396.1 hypothetical protein KGF54_004470 [Candida jiufengensis]